jgi:hypothetical protein
MSRSKTAWWSMRLLRGVFRDEKAAAKFFLLG